MAMSAMNSGRPGHENLGPGQRLDRYELLCPLDKGGMAAVWLAHQRGKHDFRRVVAIKTILPEYAADPRFRRMFLDEARLVSRIEHANVVRVLDLGEVEDILYLAMEWVEGDSLFKVEKKLASSGHSIPQGVLLRILADACRGLHEAHELTDPRKGHQGVVHRDVSPQNLLVDVNGTTKVIDFGIAKARDRLRAETTAGVVKGKLAYMAPEQALGRPLDRRADIWAIGAIFYRMLRGKPPFDASRPIEVLDLVNRGTLREPIRPSAIVGPAVAEVMNRALSPSPTGRFGTALELHDAIERAMSRAGISTTSRDVGAFLGAQFAARAAARRRVLDAAIDAAVGRERSAGALASQAPTVRPPAPPSSGEAVTAPPPSPEGDGSTIPDYEVELSTSALIGERAPPSEPATPGPGVIDADNVPSRAMKALRSRPLATGITVAAVVAAIGIAAGYGANRVSSEPGSAAAVEHAPTHGSADVLPRAEHLAVPSAVGTTAVTTKDVRPAVPPLGQAPAPQPMPSSGIGAATAAKPAPATNAPAPSTLPRPSRPGGGSTAVDDDGI